MALESGTQLGHYEITDKIGKGGMGEVYRARDTKLGREVAIKVLPAEFAKDTERIARLEREARMLAALNHPHIAAIHGLEEADDTRFLVLELVEGDTLAERLHGGTGTAGGPHAKQMPHGVIPVEESLKLALQIAEALEAAHEKGVIHRDLKPDNIKITPEGRVKVLDFGLAKAFEGPAGDVNLSNSPTLSMAATQQGVILGTAAYMSPEQAKGHDTDRQTDIWAFGCVLFEMLCGRRAFDGPDVPETLAAVIRGEPGWSHLDTGLSPRLRQVLQGCIRKDRSRRYHDIADVRIDLELIRENPGEVLAAPAGSPGMSRRAMLGWGLGATALAGITGAAGWSIRRPSPGLPTRFNDVLPEGRTFRNTGRSFVAVSPDGSGYVYNAAGGLYLRRLDDPEARVIPGTEEPLTCPIFSPDGESLAYWSPLDRQLKKIAVVGGAPISVTEVASNPQGISWAADDTILYAVESIMRVSADGGEPEVLVTDGGAGPELLPGGDAVLFNRNGTLYVQRLNATPEPLFPGDHARYVPSGHLVYLQGDVLYAVSFDLDSLTPTGGSVPMVEGVRGNPPQWDLSDAGTLVYVPGLGDVPDLAVETVLTWVDRSGGRTAVPDAPPRPYRHLRVSPDGRRLAVQTTDADGASDIWVHDLGGGTQMRQMTGPGNNVRPIWSPDSERLAFVSDRSGEQRIYIQRADFDDDALPLSGPAEPGVNLEPDSWHPNGVTIAFTKSGDTPRSVWTLSLEDGEEELFAPVNSQGAAFSPNGEWLAFRRNEGERGSPGTEQIRLKRFPATGDEIKVTDEGGSYPMWSRDGAELFYRRGAGGLRQEGAAQFFGLGSGNSLGSASLIAVDVVSLEPPQWSNERSLPIGGFLFYGGFRDYDITPDGERFVMMFPADQATTLPADQAESDAASRLQIKVVQNWFTELRERVPVP